jgi:hypothetical protein
MKLSELDEEYLEAFLKDEHEITVEFTMRAMREFVRGLGFAPTDRLLNMLREAAIMDQFAAMMDYGQFALPTRIADAARRVQEELKAEREGRPVNVTWKPREPPDFDPARKVEPTVMTFACPRRS